MIVELSFISFDDREILRTLLKEYRQDMLGEDPGEYKYFDVYWQNANRFPYFIKVDGAIVGFTLVNCHTLVQKEAKNIGEFYIQKEFRKRGIGKEAAKQVFNLFPGKWEVRQLKENSSARDFWIKVIKEYTDNNFQEVVLKNEQWDGWVQTFDNTHNR